MTTTEPELYYDPYDFEIDTDPYPIWRRLRDEQPLYYNERYDFYALSRFDDVERGLVDWRTYSSAKGTLLELIKTDMEIPPGLDHLRGPARPRPAPRPALAGVHAQEDERHRAEGARVLRPHPRPARRRGGFDFIARPRRRRCRCARSACCSASPRRTRRRSATASTRACASRRASCPTSTTPTSPARRPSVFEDYIDWRAEHPSDDLMTELLQAEFEDETASSRRLTRERSSATSTCSPPPATRPPPASSAGPARCSPSTPTSAASWSTTASLVPNAIEELLRFEAPSPVQARYVTADVEHHGQVVPEGSVMLLLNGSGNRDERKFPDGDRFDIHRKIDHHLSFGYGAPLLPRRRAGPPRGPRRARRGAPALPRRGRSTGTTPCRPAPRPCGAGSACRSSRREPIRDRTERPTRGSSHEGRRRRGIERPGPLHRHRPRPAGRAGRPPGPPQGAARRRRAEDAGPGTLAISATSPTWTSCQRRHRRGGRGAGRHRRPRLRHRHRHRSAASTTSTPTSGAQPSTPTSSAPSSSPRPRSPTSRRRDGAAAYLSSVAAASPRRGPGSAPTP